MKKTNTTENKFKKLFLFTSLAMIGASSSVSAVPVIDIKAPGAGVSHNIYSEFNVGKDGVVFNNSKDAVNTQLAGKIAGNSKFTNESARVIVAEVMGKSPSVSQLNGMMEVAGNKADLIIANPAGISCNGCGSINTNRLSLVAGSALVDTYSSGLIVFYINDGQVTIGKDGMKSGQTDFTDIIARAVKVNGQVQAKDLSLITGEHSIATAHYFRIADDFIFDEAASLSGKPEYALDVSSLGGMYADRISMVGTEKGVGVRNAGTLVSKSEIALKAGGSMINAGTLASKDDMHLLMGGSITNEQSAKIQAEGSLFVTAGDNIVNRGQLISGGTFNSLRAKNIFNAKDGVITAVEHAFIHADKFTNDGNVSAGGFSVHFSPTGIKHLK